MKDKVSKIRDWLDVRQFDQTGVSSGDLSLALPEAVAAAGARNATGVYIPCGEWAYSGATIDIPNTVTIAGGESVTVTGVLNKAGTPLFNMRGGNLTLRGIDFVSTGRTVYFDEAQGSSDWIRVHDCSFTDVQTAVYGRGTGGVLTEFKFTDSEVDDATYGILMFNDNTKRNIISNSSFRNIGYRAIRVGESITATDESTSAVITNNIVDTITPPAAATDANGIQALCGTVVIDGNTLNRISSNGNGRTCEGIYSKGISQTISNNSLTDAGERQAAITGKDGELATISGNTIVFTGYAGTRTTNGIICECEEYLITGNTIRGIRNGTSAIEADDSETRRGAVIGNYIMDCDAQDGILAGASANNNKNPKISIIGNVVDEGATRYGIYVYSNQPLDSAVIKSNVVRNSGSHGLYFKGTNTTHVSVSDNHFEDMSRGYQIDNVPSRVTHGSNDIHNCATPSIVTGSVTDSTNDRVV